MFKRFLSLMILFFLFSSVSHSKSIQKELNIQEFISKTEKDNENTDYYLYLSYDNDLDIKERNKKIFEGYKLAADQNIPLAQYALGAIYRDGEIVEQDYQEAFKYFKLAADQNLFVAQYDLSVAYAKGQGVQQDYQKAKEYCKLSCDNGHEKSCDFCKELSMKGY